MSKQNSIIVTISNRSQKIEDNNSSTQWYLWTLSVHVEPSDFLNKIDSVIYHLHPSFPNNSIIITNNINDFELTSKGWGEFKVKVDIVLKDQKKATLNHYLSLADHTGTKRNQTVLALKEDDFKKGIKNMGRKITQ